VSVAHWADVHALFSLQVALVEELLHNALRPLPVNVKRLCWVAQVSTMYKVLQYLHSFTYKHAGLMNLFHVNMGQCSIFFHIHEEESENVWYFHQPDKKTIK